ncbi:hypothetical protein [Dyadobacter sp. CY343]|uniref:hypothetical protein n=1 Tax=Dyadobacter sp. CY343 TaxID=2907299 RepID=UPI001F2C5188|nr:hypothetical protein [Dyadobacter sp. CY343]MCE7059208.1 hypothetical protein [Dyadobacter sp. CY343]
MPSNLKRTVEEILTLYSLEPTIKDIYVEGPMDKSIIDLFVGVYSIECNVYEIDSSIDFSELMSKDPLLGSNRNKLISFASQLTSATSSQNILCIIDKDFDDFISGGTYNQFLLRSDYSCIEAYVFNEEIIGKILKIGFSNFPLEANQVIEELAKVLPPLFFLRCLREIDADFKPTALLKIDNAFSASRGGIITFDLKDYVERFCHKNAISNRSEYVIKEVRKMLENYQGDVRNSIHGHDFANTFFRYVNSVKNTQQFKDSSFEKTLFIALEMSTLTKYELFDTIYKRFNLESPTSVS